ncbi:MAG: biosynthetic-type acetolactate synthase large subunit [Bacillota bacterium]
MTGAQFLWSSLVEHGVEVIFGYPGGAVIPVYDVLPPSIRHVLVRHEQAAAMAADGYARATGRLGACIATSGPGALNLLCGLTNAFLDSVPVLAVTGQVPTGQLGRDAFQETDIFGATMPLTKHNYLVSRVEDLPRVLNEAIYLAQAGRKGPVLVDLPRDVAEGEVPAGVDATPRLPGYKPRRDGHPAQVARAAEALASARRPLLLSGGGVKWAEAGPLVVGLAEKAGLPVASTLMGLGTMPADHPLFLGMIGMHGTVAANRAVQECDVLLALGVRFSDRVTGKREAFAQGAQVIHVDVDPAELGKNVPAHIPIVGDVGRVLEALIPLVPERRNDEWLAQVGSFRCRAGQDGMGVRVVRALASATGDLARQGRLVLVTDVGQHQMWVAQHYPFYHPRTLLTSGGLGAMGYGLPAAVGAQVGCPDKTVVLVTGDGSLQMNLQELATVKQEQLPIKIVLLDNGSLGMVRQWQDMFFGGNLVAVSLQGPDWLALAQAYGIRAWRVTDPGELEDGLSALLAEPGPGLLHCLVPADEKVLPMVPAGEPLARIIVSW